jgi:hypothetical protein
MAGFGADVIASAITTDIGILSAARHMVMKAVQRRPRKHWFADLKAEALACWVRRTSDPGVELGLPLWATVRVGSMAEPRSDPSQILTREVGVFALKCRPRFVPSRVGLT